MDLRDIRIFAGCENAGFRLVSEFKGAWMRWENSEFSPLSLDRSPLLLGAI